MFKQLSVALTVILVLCSGISARTIFQDDFTTFSGWNYLPGNCTGFTLNSDGNNLYVESYRDCSALQWEGVIQDLPELLLSDHNYAVALDIEVTSDPADQIGGVQVELIDDEDNVAALMRWIDPQVSSGYGGVYASIQGTKIYGDESGLDQSYPTLDGTIILKKDGYYWSLWVDNVQLASPQLFYPPAIINRISISFYNFGTSEYEHRDIKLDRIRIISPLKILIYPDYFLLGTEQAILDTILSDYYADVTWSSDTLHTLGLQNDYDLVWISDPYCIQKASHQNMVDLYIEYGGRLIVEGRVPYRLAGSSYDLSPIPWIGANHLSPAGDSIRLTVNNPFGTLLMAGLELHVPGLDPLNPVSPFYELNDLTTGTAVTNYHFGGNGAHMLKNTVGSAKILYTNSIFCVNKTGNADCSLNDVPDISDIVRIIDYLYLSKLPLCDPVEADVNVSGGEPDIADIVRLIDFLYLSRRPLACRLDSGILYWPDDLLLFKAAIHWMIEDRLPSKK